MLRISARVISILTPMVHTKIWLFRCKAYFKKKVLKKVSN